jgi:hypothetical protein
MVAARAPLSSRRRRFLGAYTDTRVSVYARRDASSPGARDERRKGASGAAAEHTEPEANVRLPGAKRETGTSDGKAPRAQQPSIEERSDGLRHLERGTSRKYRSPGSPRDVGEVIAECLGDRFEVRTIVDRSTDAIEQSIHHLKGRGDAGGTFGPGWTELGDERITFGCRVDRRIESEGISECEEFGSSLDVRRGAIRDRPQVDLERNGVSTRTEEVRMGEQSIEALVEI